MFTGNTCSLRPRVEQAGGSLAVEIGGQARGARRLLAGEGALLCGSPLGSRDCL